MSANHGTQDGCSLGGTVQMPDEGRRELQAVAHVKAAGLCLSDVGFMHGKIDWMRT